VIAGDRCHGSHRVLFDAERVRIHPDASGDFELLD